MKVAPDAFIDTVAPIAVLLRIQGSAIFPSVRIAQALLETGSTLHPWNNLVGYKVGGGQPTPYWHGRSVSRTTWEVYDGVRVDGVQSDWRAYDTIADGFRDQDLLFLIPRYDRVRASKTPKEQTVMLQVCGYATDPAYPAKLQSLIAVHDLERYDEEAEERMPMKLEHDWQWNMLGDALDGLYSQGLITDRSWVDKAYKQELTQAELTWLNTILFARKNGVKV
ncbi:glycoside hydrolase family 73 protein [Paenibacillus sp. MBLB4367]|uniref:glycoside hydrolase family 73 protein n=1 Tax=Paenibacillus sp. MBLB4367 TaxID=3384767 RepID=UPI0039081F82